MAKQCVGGRRDHGQTFPVFELQDKGGKKTSTKVGARCSDCRKIVWGREAKN